MRIIALSTGLLIVAVSPAAAQCIAIPNGSGQAAIHCQDGRVGSMQLDGAGGAAGMVGGQAFAGSVQQIAPLGLGPGAVLDGLTSRDLPPAPRGPHLLRAPGNPRPEPPSVDIVKPKPRSR